MWKFIKAYQTKGLLKLGLIINNIELDFTIGAGKK